MNIKLLISKALKIILNPPAVRECEISKNAKVCSKSELNFTSVGDYSYIGYQCYAAKASIGKFCSIGDGCKIGGPSHPIDWVSTSPVFHAGKNVLRKNFSKHDYVPFASTVIENDVWLGNNVLVKAGVRISTGAVIGMGSVVTHDVGPYEIWAGNPAKMVRKRFDEETIYLLLKSKWWDLSDSELQQCAVYFNNPRQFFKHVKNRTKVCV